MRFFKVPAGQTLDTHESLDNDNDNGCLERRRHSACHDVAWMRSDRRDPHEEHFPQRAMIDLVETRV